jgi:hypothetical protein
VGLLWEAFGLARAEKNQCDILEHHVTTEYNALIITCED